MIGRAFAIVCYLLALVGAGAFACFVLLLGDDVLPPRPFLIPWPWALVLNLAWLLLFALQHSGMAREVAKRSWLVPAHLARSVYAALSGLLLVALVLVWQPLPGPPLWSGPGWLVVVPFGAGIGLALINARHDHAELFGLRQAWAEDRPAPPERLVVIGPYRHLRHPLMACLLAFLWAQPVMSPTLALLAGGLTAYVLLGTVLEERDLLRRFHPEYAAYRRRVPALVPWRLPFSRGLPDD